VVVVVGAVRGPLDWRSLARGWAESEEVVSSSDMASELLEELEVLRRSLWVFLFTADGLAHSGTGYRRSNWRRNRFVYSLPLTRSSDSEMRSFRRRGFDTKETIIRSSSLSIHAAAFSPSDGSSSESCVGKRSGMSTTDGLESRKNS